MEVIAIADKVQPKAKSGSKAARILREKRGSYDIGAPHPDVFLKISRFAGLFCACFMCVVRG